MGNKITGAGSINPRVAIGDRISNGFKLLNDARERSEELIEILQGHVTTVKPHTYREVAGKKYLRTAQKKKKTKREIRNFKQ